MNDKLGPKNYAKFDRTYMAFGSIMNALQGYVAALSSNRTKDDPLDEINRITDWAWAKAKKQTSDLIDELYKDNGDNDEKVL